MRLASRRARGAAVVIALSLALIGGCTGNGSEGSAAGPPATGAPEQSGGEGGGARVEEFGPDDAVAELTVTLPTSPEDEVTWGVLPLRVEGEVMTLRLAVTPNFGSVGENASISLYDCMQRASFAPVLVDLEHLKEYSVIRDTGLPWVSDPVYTKAVNGQTMLAWAVYAAPQDDINTITVRIADWWPAVLDVPIVR